MESINRINIDFKIDVLRGFGQLADFTMIFFIHPDYYFAKKFWRILVPAFFFNQSHKKRSSDKKILELVEFYFGKKKIFFKIG